MKSVSTHSQKQERQRKFHSLTFTLCDADILIEPLPFCWKDFSKAQFKMLWRQLSRSLYHHC